MLCFTQPLLQFVDLQHILGILITGKEAIGVNQRPDSAHVLLEEP
jgi:hypothetical protein